MISVRRGILHEADTDGVLRPVRSDLAGITSAGRRLEAAAGEGVRARLEGMGELPVGGAVVTPGGDLAAGFVIHAVIEGPEEGPTALGVRRALVNGLRRARDWEIGSLALPPLGLGAGSLDPEAAAGALVEALVEHARDGAPPTELVIVVESDFEEDLFRRAIAAAGLT